MVIGTTLTRVYLWDEIQDRRFDTVILDEASLAPIPALWTVACLADANVVVIGDVRQLPPTNQAEHPLVETWLSRDVFDVSRVRSGLDCGIPPPHFIHLNERCG
jgi:superfamily I DNA and/or RNA helicase